MKHLTLLIFCTLIPFFSISQDLLSLIEEDKPTHDYSFASFKTNRVVNLHSLENTAEGVLDFKISHRFNAIENGFYDLFGMDGATIRLGFDYGLSELIQIGVGRNVYRKTFDGYIKYKFLRQQKGLKNIPFSLIFLANSDVTSLKKDNFEFDIPFWDRFNYTFQFIAGSKVNDKFSFELVPSLVHRNIVATHEENNDVFAMGIGLRQKISKRVSLNLEYIFVPGNQLPEQYTNSLSLGFDIETGGHVFQLHLTNSSLMYESGFITLNTDSWNDRGIHLGFNISRVFTVKQVK